MRFKRGIIILVLLICVCEVSQGQQFDSTHIYAISMRSSYYVRMDKDMIQADTSPDVIRDAANVSAIYRLVQDTLKGVRLGRLKTDNSLDLRLFFQFFKQGKVVKEVGFTPYKTMNVGRELYSYEIENLKKLDFYVENLTKRLGVN